MPSTQNRPSTQNQGLAHIVVFTLQDSSPSTVQAFLADCRNYLDGHPGVVHFSAGERGPEFDRPVNDSEYHVSIHVVFESKAAHDTYQTAARHLEFIERNKANWAAVRVFDSYVG